MGYVDEVLAEGNREKCQASQSSCRQLKEVLESLQSGD